MSDVTPSHFPDVRSVLPHREPFLFVDRVVSLELGDAGQPGRIVAVKTFRKEEPFFAGHFPDQPVVPGVLLVEGLAQTLAYLALSQAKSRRAFLVGIDRARFRAIVEPGTEVTYEVTAQAARFGMRRGEGRVLVGERAVAEATLTGYSGDP